MEVKVGFSEQPKLVKLVRKHIIDFLLPSHANDNITIYSFNEIVDIVSPLPYYLPLLIYQQMKRIFPTNEARVNVAPEDEVVVSAVCQL